MLKRPIIFLVATLISVSAVSAGAAANHIFPSDDISGRVVAEDGSPQAGVWVIVASQEVMAWDGRRRDTYRKIVVTNDEGKFVVPDLPDATYDIWARGYGILDSKPTPGPASERHRPGELLARPGDTGVIVEVELAETPQEAAQVYPANYWYSLLELPPPEAFKADDGYIKMATQKDWVSELKLGCTLCHQVGTYATRLNSREAFDLGLKKIAVMNGIAHSFGREALLDTLGEWGEKIEAGAVPPSPPRPEGIERNVVITEWEFGDIYTYVHDTIGTDRRDPTVNAGGPFYGADIGGDWQYIIYPFADEPTWTRMRLPVYNNSTIKKLAGFVEPAPDGDTTWLGAWEHRTAYPHNPMMDAEGNVWYSTKANGRNRPEGCPDDGAVGETVHRWNPDTEEWWIIPTCFGTHHLEFADNGILYFSGDSRYIGWLDPSKYDPNNPEETFMEAQGWSRVRVDSDGDGVADTPVNGFRYGVWPSPDGTVWSAVPGVPGHIERYDPETDTHEIYNLPAPAHGPRGIAVDSKGIVWTAAAGSGHLLRFDRSKCDQTWGTGDQCPEGWTMWRTPGPEFSGEKAPGTVASADMHYYLFVDRHNASGLGKDAVIICGTNSDSLIWFDQETEEMHVFRVPYPLGYYTRLSEARIDDPDAGWKGRGLWSSYNTTTSIHTETRRPSLVRMQFRPDPLAH